MNDACGFCYLGATDRDSCPALEAGIAAQNGDGNEVHYNRRVDSYTSGKNLL